MLRRPVGLLPTVTARAVTSAESIGHISVQVMPAAKQMSIVEQASMEGAHAAGQVQPQATARNVTVASTLATVAEHGAGALQRALPLVPVQRCNSAERIEGNCARASAWPMSVAVAAGNVQTTLPWVQVRRMPPTCTSFGSALGKEQPLEATQERVAIIEAARSKGLACRQLTHYKCLSCRALIPNEQKTCGKCGYTRGENGAFALLEREKQRAASRQNTRQGRRRNKCSDAVVPALGLEVVPVSAFEQAWSGQLAAKKQKISQETQALAMARCGEMYVECEDSHACVFESFLQVRCAHASIDCRLHDHERICMMSELWCWAFSQVHYFGRMSVHDSARIDGVDEYVVADFFNTVSNVKMSGSQQDGTACSEPRFPFGGYWQAMTAH